MSDVPTPQGGAPVVDSAPTSTSGADPFKTLTRKVKVYGQEKEMTADEAFSKAQRVDAADKKFEEAAKIRKETEEIRSLMKSDVAKALEREGFSKEQIRTAFEDYLIKELEEQSLSPEQKAQRERDRKLEEYEKAAKEREEQENLSKQEKEQQVALEAIETELIDALSASELPKNPFLAKWVAQKMRGAYMNGYDITATEAVKEVEGEFKDVLSGVLSGVKSDVRKLESFLGKEVVAAIRESGVASVKKAEQAFAKPRQEVAKPAAKQQEEELKPRADFFNELRGIKRR